MKPIKVLIVDDSSVMRSILKRFLSRDELIRVVAEAADPFEARAAIVKETPDVMILDINMPKMDGLTFLKKVMAAHPVRTLVYSSFTKKNSEEFLKAMSAGAIDVLEKPSIRESQDFEAHSVSICQKIKAASRANLAPIPSTKKQNSPKIERASFPATKLVVIAASTGGTEALKVVIPALEGSDLGILVVQHLPAAFVGPYVKLIASQCHFPVRIAQDGEEIQGGSVYFAPGDYHMRVVAEQETFHISLNQEAKIFGLRPAADPLMKSLADVAPHRSMAVILTGMGKDGSQGALQMKQTGAYNIAQDEKSCVVYGMPKEAVRIGAIDKVVNLEEISKEIVSFGKKKTAA